MKRFLQQGVLALAVLCSGAVFAAGETVIFRENFDRHSAGVLPRRGNFSGGTYHTQGAAHSWSISNEQCASKPYALIVLRVGSSGQIGIVPDKKILPVVNYSVEFKIPAASP